GDGRRRPRPGALGRRALRRGDEAAVAAHQRHLRRSGRSRSRQRHRLKPPTGARQYQSIPSAATPARRVRHADSLRWRGQSREGFMAVIIGVARASAPGERRVALTPETAKKLVAAGASVRVQRGLGALARFPDQAYADAGAELVDGDVLADADLVLCVQPPPADALATMKTGAALVGALHPQADEARAAAIRERGIVAFPLERLPRTTRAQAMDILSSQAGMAGYKAVLIAAQLAPRFFPMLTTAAGTIRPSKVLIVGAGVAGLQAVATA